MSCPRMAESAAEVEMGERVRKDRQFFRVGEERGNDARSLLPLLEVHRGL